MQLSKAQTHLVVAGFADASGKSAQPPSVNVPKPVALVPAAALPQVGWHRIVSVSQDMLRVVCSLEDHAGRTHTAELHLSSEYPLQPPRCHIALPKALQTAVPSADGGTLQAVLAACEAALDKYQPFFAAMDAVDRSAKVLQPPGGRVLTSLFAFGCPRKRLRAVDCCAAVG